MIAYSPAFFEKVCVDLMIAMGYGYDQSESGKITQYSKDGIIDDIIYADKLIRARKDLSSSKEI